MIFSTFIKYPKARTSNILNNYHYSRAWVPAFYVWNVSFMVRSRTKSRYDMFDVIKITYFHLGSTPGRRWLRYQLSLLSPATSGLLVGDGHSPHFLVIYPPS